MLGLITNYRGLTHSLVFTNFIYFDLIFISIPGSEYCIGTYYDDLFLQFLDNNQVDNL